MTVREKLTRLRGRIALLGLVGGLLFLVGLVAGTADPEKLAFAIAGSVVLLVAAFELAFGLRCPRCDARIGPAMSWPPARWLGRSKIAECPSCHIDLDSEARG